MFHTLNKKKADGPTSWDDVVGSDELVLRQSQCSEISDLSDISEAQDDSCACSSSSYHRSGSSSSCVTTYLHHPDNPPEISLRVLLPLLKLLEQRHGFEQVDRVVSAAGRAVGVTDGSISYASFLESSPDDVWNSLNFHNMLRDEIFSRLYGMDEPPERSHPLWQLWRQAGVYACSSEGLGERDLWRFEKAFGGPGVVYRNSPSRCAGGELCRSYCLESCRLLC